MKMLALVIARRARSPLVLAAAIVLPALAPRPAAAADPSRRKMPEPVLEESVTDIDRDEAGELELDAIGRVTRSSDAARHWQSSAELEWGATDRLGIAVESGGSGRVDSGEAKKPFDGVEAALSFALVHDGEHDFHLQTEMNGRFFGAPASSSERAEEPGEVAAPYGVGLRTGWRIGEWTMRGALGGEVGAASPHLPLRATFGLFTAFGRDERAGFFGVELGVDGGRSSPFFGALDAVASLESVGLPIRIGVASPYAPSVAGQPASLGIVLRVIVEAD